MRRVSERAPQLSCDDGELEVRVTSMHTRLSTRRRVAIILMQTVRDPASRGSSIQVGSGELGRRCCSKAHSA